MTAIPRSQSVESPPTFEQIIRRRVVYTVPGMEHAQLREGLPYKNADGASLSFDLYAPAGASRPRPAVILIHGGPVPVLGARRWGMFVSYGRRHLSLSRCPRPEQRGDGGQDSGRRRSAWRQHSYLGPGPRHAWLAATRELSRRRNPIRSQEANVEI